MDPKPIKSTGMVVVSPGDGTLIKQDWKAIGTKALYALGPFILVCIPIVIDLVPKDWVYLPMALYLAERLKDYIVYATKETRYSVESK